MRVLFLPLLLLSCLAIHAQDTIWSHAIGNWKNGPVVYLSPVIETSEAVPKARLTEQYKEQFKELREAADLDVLLFATPEEAEESRQTLRMKYGTRKLEVVLLETQTVPSQKEKP
jgi:hypothetical protein